MKNSGSGAAYVFDRNQGGPSNWGEVAKLTASDGAAGDQFSWLAAAISGHAVVVGAFWDDDGGSDSGSAYVFERDRGGPNNWGEVAKFTTSDAATNDRFGHSVAISGDTSVGGAYLDNVSAIDDGPAYVFMPPSLNLFIGERPATRPRHPMALPDRPASRQR